MPRTRPTLAALLVLAVLGASGAGAHQVSFPLAGKRVLLKSGKSAKKRRFVFQAHGASVSLASPQKEATALLVVGVGDGAGTTGLIELDASKWKAIRNGFRYRDPKGLRGGVKKIVVKHDGRGGKIKVVAGGPRWPWRGTGAQEALWVLFRVEQEWHCAYFGGKMSAKAGRLKANNAKAPAECPASICGNGQTELGEQCDDGDLDNTDGCTIACAEEACDGEAFAGTWEAIRKNVIAKYDCANASCHSGPLPQGGLDLSGDPLDRLVNVPSTDNPDLDRIEPGDQDLSVLWLRLAKKTRPDQYLHVPGTPMPTGTSAALSEDELEALRLFIRAGAPATGVVEGTGTRLASCLPPAVPQKIPPPAPPPFGQGIQLHAPPWDLPAKSEDEVCYATYYDLTQVPGLVPLEAQTPCPPWMGGPSETCFRYHETLLAQDPQSHHSIIHAYRGAYDTTHPGWGAWTCRGGPMAGTPCVPTGIGVPAPAGADCGAGGGCAGAVRSTIACILYGPPDYSFNNNVAPTFGGSQEALSSQLYAPGVYNVVPMKSIVVWNSHAFNLTSTDTTMEQYLNLTFAKPADQVYQVQGIFDDSEIFVQNVPPFETREYCRTVTLPLDTQLFELSSHVHKRGVLFRWWGPPNASCTAAGGCKPNPEPPIYVSTEYNDPVQLRLSPPWPLHATDPAARRFKFCSVYDNGATDPGTVKRRSTSPAGPLGGLAPGGPCAVEETQCVGGPRKGQLCHGDDIFCDSYPGANDGDCDACALRGGVTTEDEMFIGLGSYYIAP